MGPCLENVPRLSEGLDTALYEQWPKELELLGLERRWPVGATEPGSQPAARVCMPGDGMLNEGQGVEAPEVRTVKLS